jgi:uncharacterized protein (DUF433 family)
MSLFEGDSGPPPNRTRSGDYRYADAAKPCKVAKIHLEDTVNGYSPTFVGHLRGQNNMLLNLSREDRKYLEKFANRKMRPTNWQKAQALLGLARGESLERVSIRVGITKEDLSSLVDRFTEGGLKGVGLEHSGREGSGRSQPRRYATIEKAPAVCGGAARVAGTRIPVWQLVEARSLGASEAQLLIDYPRLKAANLVDAWAYSADHPDEIATQIHTNRVA